MAHEWNIRPRGHVCQHCQKPFTDGDVCVSALRETTSAESLRVFERLDGCRTCGTGGDVAVLSVWQGVYRQPAPPAADPAPRQTVETLLRQLMEGDTTEEHKPLIFILALMLERKKLLIERDARPQPDGTLLRVYEHRATGEALLVVDPQLQPKDLEPVQKQIAALLAGQEEAPADAGPGVRSATEAAPTPEP